MVIAIYCQWESQLIAVVTWFKLFFIGNLQVCILFFKLFEIKIFLKIFAQFHVVDTSLLLARDTTIINVMTATTKTNMKQQAYILNRQNQITFIGVWL